jgi:hypothetical protein
MKYIFVAGAPGSKWSSVVKNIYYSPSVDRSDYRDEWTYYHDASGKTELMHMGAYFDPGMACPLPESLSVMTRKQAEASFDSPFNADSTGVRIIKSHVFCYQENLEYLREQWPDCPIVLVHRGDDSCLGWWVKCGHFDITYPDYSEYYKDLKHMAQIIQRQNKELLNVWHSRDGREPGTNRELARLLKLDAPPLQYAQDYATNDIEVKVI